MRKFYHLIVLLFIASLAVFFNHGTGTEVLRKKLTKKERIDGAIEDHLFTSSDVDLGTIPYDKLFKAIDEGQKRLSKPSRGRSLPGSITNPNWRERGPSNRGGRTRAIMIDESDPFRNRIWIGGVSGGLWRTEDITQEDPKWFKLGLYFESLAISDISQDPYDLDVIYVSTGESYTGDIEGAGIFKSMDDGVTWTLLPSTKNSILQTVNEIHVHNNGDIYAATSDGGLMRSQDGGEVWEQVLGTGMPEVNSNNFHDFYYHKVNQTFYTSNDNSIYKSSTGDRNDWISIGRGKPGFPNNVNRVEFSICPSDPEILYAIGAVGSYSSNTFVSNNGGEDWISRPEPAIFGDYGQAWYDLEINSDPSNCFRLLSGGVNMAESIFQGLTWRVIADNMHVDHHNITFDPQKPGRILFGNDGGIWLSENGGQSVVDISRGYVTTQFYAGAIHPDAGSPYVIGGTQDNNSLIISEAGLSPSRTAWGGDGVFCFIDQNEPNIQIVSSQGGHYGLSLDAGFVFEFGASIDGAFINRSGYDDDANILYGQINQSGVDDIDFFRWNVNTLQIDQVDITGKNVIVTAVKADPDIANRVYFGGQSGLVIRTDNAHTGDNVQGTVFADFPGNASVSCIYMDKQTSDHALISLFNYGASLENIWVTYDGGAEWNSIEGDLPDLPVRWAIFDPANHDRAMIATDAGIWTTDDINGDQTHWEPNNPIKGMPFVRVDMLLMRESDKAVLAATYGRGLMTTDIFSSPAPVILSQEIAYEDQPLIIDGSQSVNGQSFEWNFGDNTTSTEETVTHTYTAPGTYIISLTINGVATQTKSITILPYLSAPYEPGITGYAGDFESSPEHFAAYLIQGTGFQRGVSTKPGKDGTHSGSTAWVLGINDNLYQNNTRTEFFTPMYDLSQPGLYELKFWTKYAIQNRNDGFQVEYSIDGGESWQQLGNRDDPYWYNYYNDNLFTGAFQVGKSYFTNAQPNWTQYIKDISFLAGESTVSFRYIFRSNYEVQAQGLAIDDFEITKYEGELKTTVTIFNAGYTGEQDVTINWITGIEYQCQKFILERSYTGFGFTQVGELPAAGVVSTFANEYTWIDKSLRKVIYYRLKVINENPDINYFFEFYTDTIVVRRDVEPDIVNYVLTNPFSDRIEISFSSIINQQITLRLFDLSGKLVKYNEAVPNGVVYSLDNIRRSLPPGIYILSVQIGEEEPTIHKLFTLGN